MGQATITIAAVSPKKSGTTNGRRWTLYEIHAKDGATYTTFDADGQRHVGETVEAGVSARNRLGAFPKAAVLTMPATTAMPTSDSRLPSTGIRSCPTSGAMAVWWWSGRLS